MKLFPRVLQGEKNLYANAWSAGITSGLIDISISVTMMQEVEDVMMQRISLYKRHENIGKFLNSKSILFQHGWHKNID